MERKNEDSQQHLTVIASGKTITDAWSVWLHPRLSFRLLCERDDTIKSLKLRVEMLEQQLEQTSGQLNEQRLENARQGAENITLATKLKRSDDSVLYLGKEIVRLRAELQEYSEIEVEMQKFQQQLSKVEEMKAGYELRIKRLKASLSDARELVRQLSGKDELEEPDVINMTGEEPEPSSEPENKDEDDWLKPLPLF